MVKSFKKAIAIIISVLMITTSLPFTALTASAAVSIPSNLSAQTANAKPEAFNAVGKLSTADAPAGTYSNLVYQGTDKDEKGEDKQYLGHGVITQKKTVIVYDGAHEASAPVYAKFWPTGSSKVQLCYTYISNSKPVALNEWVGSYKTNTTNPTLPYNPNGDTLLNYQSHDANRVSFTTSDHSKCGSGEAWIFWTGQRYTGVGNTTDYYEKISGVTYQTGHRNDNWGWGNRTYDYTPTADVYVLNYKPVYEVLNNTAKVKVNETNTEYTFKDLFNTVWGNENSYTADSLQAYYNAVSALVGLNVNSYFSSANDSNVEAQTQSAASAIKTAYNNYVSAVNGLKRQYKVTVVDANDVVKATGYFEAGTDVSAFVNSYLPANTYDALKHYSYSWTPAIATVSDDVTYKVTVASGSHLMQNNGASTPATCTTDGSQPTKCVACNFTSATTLTKLGHSFTIYLNAYTTNSDFDESATYQHAAGCNNGCGEVDYQDCTFGAWTTVDGDSTKEFKRCTVCGGQVVRDKAIDKITITFVLPDETVVSEKTVDIGAEVDAPVLDSYAKINATGHYSYSFENAKYSASEDTTVTATENFTAHAYGEYVEDNNATCTADGTKTAKCTVSADCTFDDVKTISDSAIGHSWVNPTENLDDTHTFTCENGCGESKTEDCSFTVETENVPATCTVDGYVINACDVCGKEKRTTNTALGHDYSSAVTDPTCTESGYTTYTCTRGDSQYNADYTDPTGHSWSKNVVESTCTENAYTINACANCEETKDKTDLYTLTEVKDIDASVEYLDIKGNNKQVTEFDLGFDVEEVTFTFACHTYNGWFSDSKIYVYDYAGNQVKSYDANSLMENQTITLYNTRAYIKVDYQPTDDKDFFTVSSVKVLDSQFKAKGHDMQDVPGTAIEATCTDPGRSADKACSRCDATEEGTTVTAVGHSFTVEQSRTTATCVTVGSVTYSCANGCSETYTEYGTKDATNHAGTVALDESTVVAATAETKGYTGDKICDACNEVAEYGEETDALGYTITFKTKAGASVAHNFPVGTTADELRAWAVENAPIDAPTATSHFSWSAYTNSGMVTVAKNATYTMSTASDKGAIRHTYDDVFSEIDGMIYREAATCKGCDYERAYTRMEASYTNADGEEVYAINLSSAITEAVKLQNSTVKVYGDVDYTVTAIKSISASDRTVTIDLNGATVTAPNGLKLAGSGAWVITGDGTITTGETNKSVYTVSYTGSGSLTIENGTFVSDKDEDGEGNATIFMNSTSDNAKIVVNGGTFDGVPYKGKSYILNKLDGSKGTIEVNGGTFIGYNPLTDNEITADADLLADDSVAGEFTVVDGTDYITALNAAKAQAAAVNPDEWTAESYANLQTAVAMSEATKTISATDAKTAAILTAIDELVKKTVVYTVTFNVEVDGEAKGTKTSTGLYGDVASVDVADLLDGAKAYKWTVEQDGSITKLPLTDSAFEMYITGDATVTVYATSTAPVEAGTKKVTILDKSGRTIGVSYVSAETTLNKTEETIAGVDAPKVAFYDFAGWEEVKPNVYQATYDLPAPSCNIHLEDGLVLVKGEDEFENSYTAYYDEVLNIKSNEQLAISPNADHSNAVLIKRNSLIHAPKAADAYIFVAPAELVASAQVTGIYTQDSSASFNVIANASGYEIVECGVYAIRSAETIDNTFAFSKNQAGVVKIRSNTQSENGEFTITIKSGNNFAGYKTVYGMPYVVYKDALGNLKEVTGTAVGIIVNE